MVRRTPQRLYVQALTRRATLGGVATLVSRGAQAASPPPPVTVDHHVHVHSPAILAFLPAYCDAVSRFGKCDPGFTAHLTPDDLISAMDAAGVRRSLLLSTGYLAESSMVTPRREDATDLLRAANDWTVSQARRRPDRFRAFIAVDPRAPSALPEIARWRGRPGVSGVKIHLTSSGLDLRRDADADTLADVFRAASAAHMAIVIHLRTQVMDYGAQDMLRFLERVLPAAGRAPVQIAHAGGWGEIDDATLSALGAFVAAAAERPERFGNVQFDLAGVWKATTPAALKMRLADLMRRAGLPRFLPGSDWPFVRDLADEYGRVYPTLLLTESEWRGVRQNVAPYA